MSGEENKRFRKLIEDVKHKLGERYNITRLEIEHVANKPRLLIGSRKRPKKGGTNKHKKGSRWVTVSLDYVREEYEVYMSYKKDGIAGASDESKTLPLQETKPEDVVEFVEKHYL